MNTENDITEILEHFRDDQDVMRSTRNAYYNVVRIFFRWVMLSGYDWRQLHVSHIIKFKDKLFDDGKTNRTIRFYLVVIKIFFRWLADNGIYQNIAEGIRMPRKEKTFSRRPLTAEQVHRFMSFINTETIIGKRDYALFALLFTTGLRSISVENMDIGDIRQQDGQLVIWYKNKGHRQKDLFKPLTDRCSEAIHDYLLARGKIEDHWPLFASHSNYKTGNRLSQRMMEIIFKKRLADVGIIDRRITLHSTRHTHGTIGTKRVGIYETQLSLNHASASTTRIYNQTADEYIILENKTGKVMDAIL